eukprot:Amastigsp_a676970_15.p2 type:complete len:227 gc:universal Amastigsp_a676970_15:136-816(+)
MIIDVGRAKTWTLLVLARAVTSLRSTAPSTAASASLSPWLVSPARSRSTQSPSDWIASLRVQRRRIAASASTSGNGNSCGRWSRFAESGRSSSISAALTADEPRCLLATDASVGGTFAVTRNSWLRGVFCESAASAPKTAQQMSSRSSFARRLVCSTTMPSPPSASREVLRSASFPTRVANASMSSACCTKLAVIEMNAANGLHRSMAVRPSMVSAERMRSEKMVQ